MTSSWVEISPKSDFSLSNIPFGVCSFSNNPTSPRCCTAVGDYAVDLYILAEAGLLDGIEGLSSPTFVFGRGELNTFMGLGREVWVGVRDRLIALFSSNSSSDGADPALKDDAPLRSASMNPLSSVTMHLPARIGDYTDFYSSREHATNVGTMFRGKDNALQPNWLHLPVGYHGRSSTVYVSGTPIRRPCGQLQKDKDDPKKGSAYGPSKLLDFELEMAFFVGGKPNPPGTKLTIDQAKERIFGYVLMNDWSARDIQKWEYVPLGPFGSKNFGTSISPWIVTSMAIEQYKCETSAKVQDDPVPLEYIRDPQYSSYDIHLEVSIQGSGMKEAGRVCKSNFRNLYWNAPQQLVHHSVTGCVLNSGDLLASGTISGSDKSSFGSMLELSWRGSREVKLGDGEEVRKFLKDGDNVVMRGWCGDDDDDGSGSSKKGRVGFGVCEGKILPADPDLTANGGEAESAAPAEAVEDRYREFKLYSYYRSSCSWRVRTALAAKSIPYTTVPVNLLKSEQTSSDNTDRNRMGQVPVLECVDSHSGKTLRVTQSLAIIEFLEDILPEKGGSLLPNDPARRAAAREIAEVVAGGIQPLQNLSVMKSIDDIVAAASEADESKTESKPDEGKKKMSSGRGFGKQAIVKGLQALESLVVTARAVGSEGGGGEDGKSSPSSGPYAVGTYGPTIADACIIPQLYNARRFGVDDMEKLCPALLEVENVALKHDWFVKGHPDNQPDAPGQKKEEEGEKQKKGGKGGEEEEPANKKARVAE